MSKAAATKKPAGLFLLEGISCLVFNKDFKKCALSKNDNKVYIYDVPDIMKTDTWKLEAELEAHLQYVSGLDWCHFSNEILSCSHDKTAFVWQYSNKKWISSNVVATTKLGYLCCKWNKTGSKFCAGTSAKHLFIGYYNTSSNWWMCMNIKVHKSSVCCCEIDPTSLFVISGSSDMRVYVSSCYIPQVDDSQLTDATKPLAQKFGDVIYEFKPGSWLNSVAWNNSGSLGFASSQNATIAVLDKNKKETELIKCDHSPANLIVPNGDDSFYAVCYDRHIYEYKLTGGKWAVAKKVTEDKKGAQKQEEKRGSVSDALKKFQTMNMQKKENLIVSSKASSNVHGGLISSVVIKGKDMMTTDFAGFVKYWKL